MLLSSDSDDSANRTLLEEAKKATRNSSGYPVEASGNTDTGSIVISGEIAGDNFDLTHVGQSLRFRAVRGNYWKVQTMDPLGLRQRVIEARTASSMPRSPVTHRRIRALK